MTWTRNKPTVAGWYWRRYAGEPAVVRVIHSMYGLVIEGHVGLVQNMNAHWLGPITPTDRQQGRVAGIQESKNLVSEFIEAWLLAGMVAKLLTPAVHEAVGGLSRDLRRELQKIEQAAQDEKGVGDGKDCL